MKIAETIHSAAVIAVSYSVWIDSTDSSIMHAIETKIAVVTTFDVHSYAVVWMS